MDNFPLELVSTSSTCIGHRFHYFVERKGKTTTCNNIYHLYRNSDHSCLMVHGAPQRKIYAMPWCMAYDTILITTKSTSPSKSSNHSNINNTSINHKIYIIMFIIISILRIMFLSSWASNCGLIVLRILKPNFFM